MALDRRADHRRGREPSHSSWAHLHPEAFTLADLDELARFHHARVVTEETLEQLMDAKLELRAEWARVQALEQALRHEPWWRRRRARKSKIHGP